MTSWDDMLAAHARGLSLAEHGAESVTWTAFGGTPAPRAFLAHVLRGGEDQMSPAGARSKKRRAILHLPVDATAGVDQVGPKDTFTVVLQQGQAGVVCRLVQIVSELPGTIIVEVEG